MTDNDKDLNFVLGPNSAEEIARYADSIIKVLDEIDALKEHIKEAKAEAKGNGFDVRALMKVVAAKRAETQEPRVVEETIYRVYLRAAGLPVGD